MSNSYMETLWTIVAISILFIWFVASIIHQFRFDWWKFFIRFDIFNFLPNWSFFAPNPGKHDFHLVYRAWIQDQPSPWQEIVTLSGNWYLRWIWHPSRYPTKALSDLTYGLYRAIYNSNGDKTMVMFSSSYLSLLNLVMSQSPLEGTDHYRQFAIVVTQGFKEGRHIEIKFLSELHRVESNPI